MYSAAAVPAPMDRGRECGGPRLSAHMFYTCVDVKSEIDLSGVRGALESFVL